jgi:hypothetical protein
MLLVYIMLTDTPTMERERERERERKRLLPVYLLQWRERGCCCQYISILLNPGDKIPIQ